MWRILKDGKDGVLCGLGTAVMVGRCWISGIPCVLRTRPLRFAKGRRRVKAPADGVGRSGLLGIWDLVLLFRSLSLRCFLRLLSSHRRVVGVAAGNWL